MGKTFGISSFLTLSWSATAAVSFVVLSVLSFGAVLSAASRVHASEDTDSRDRDQVFTLQVENDIFFGTDEDYTNGLRASYVHKPGNNQLGDFISGLLKSGSPMASGLREADRLYYSVALGQNMYTPSDIENPDLIEGDRPYAGWLYLEFGVTAETNDGYEVVKLDIGMVGPASLAGETQRWWHEVIGSPIPQGWQHQLPNEPGLNLYYTRGQRIAPWELTDEGGLALDATPHWGFALGNVHTYAAGGITFRAGTNLRRDMGAPPRIQPSLPGSDYFGGQGFDFYVFAGAEVRAVARNLFLDGTWRSHAHSVSIKPALLEAQVGAVAFAGPVRLAFTNTFRTSEYEGSQRHRYSAFTLSYRF